MAPARASEVRPESNFPAKVDEILTEILVKDPGQRPTARELRPRWADLAVSLALETMGDTIPLDALPRRSKTSKDQTGPVPRAPDPPRVRGAPDHAPGSSASRRWWVPLAAFLILLVPLLSSRAIRSLRETPIGKSPPLRSASSSPVDPRTLDLELNQRLDEMDLLYQKWARLPRTPVVDKLTRVMAGRKNSLDPAKATPLLWRGFSLARQALMGLRSGGPQDQAWSILVRRVRLLDFATRETFINGEEGRGSVGKSWAAFCLELEKGVPEDHVGFYCSKTLLGLLAWNRPHSSLMNVTDSSIESLANLLIDFDRSGAPFLETTEGLCFITTEMAETYHKVHRLIAGYRGGLLLGGVSLKELDAPDLALRCLTRELSFLKDRRAPGDPASPLVLWLCCKISLEILADRNYISDPRWPKIETGALEVMEALCQVLESNEACKGMPLSSMKRYFKENAPPARSRYPNRLRCPILDL